MSITPDSLSLFEGKIVAVTGGARGIGKNIVNAFAQKGAMVIVCDLNDKEGHTTVTDLRDRKLSSTFLKVDLSEKGTPQEMIRQIVRSYGKIDVLVNNARAVRSRDKSDDEESWDLEMAVNLRAAFFASQAAISTMAKNGGGSIVNISSITGLLSAREVSPVYQIAKVGLTQMTRYFAVRGGAEGVRVNALLPGVIIRDEDLDRYRQDDNQGYRELVEFCHPMGQPGRSDDVAHAALFLCSPNASYISGQCIVMDGGMSVQEQFSLMLHFQKRHDESSVPI
ncbi:MAG: SDR family oxidoreductase [Chlamydiae bacterium]|nr:SDR family oxidoreductase [Chlamydiota bacterium]MBI3276253.1 SDR family oxidoreductase [Chlamydiota bacterium]